jgi:hypothetical protein
MLHPAHKGKTLIGPGGMGLPLVRPLGQVARLLRRSHIGFERGDHIDPALALHVG